MRQVCREVSEEDYSVRESVPETDNKCKIRRAVLRLAGTALCDVI